MRNVWRLGLLVLLLIGGCSPARRLSRSQAETKQEAQEVRHTESSTDSMAQVMTTTDLSKDEEVVTVLTEFDTSQPADTTTGLPPVKRRITQTKRAVTLQTQVAEHTSQERSEQTEEVTATEQVATTEVTEQTQRRGLNGVQRALCWIGLVAAVVTVVALIKRLKP
nr:MAG TPA: hypothetical protein [Caudoviricetes sp.]